MKGRKEVVFSLNENSPTKVSVFQTVSTVEVKDGQNDRDIIIIETDIFIS